MVTYKFAKPKMTPNKNVAYYKITGIISDDSNNNAANL